MKLLLDGRILQKFGYIIFNIKNYLMDAVVDIDEFDNITNA